MASKLSKLKQLQSQACRASKFVAENGTAYYKQSLEENKQYIQEPPTVEKCNELSKQLFYTRLASIPGRTESFWKELDYVKHMWKNRKELRVEDASIAALFGLECFGWFCAGEIVGRGFTFTGYYEPAGVSAQHFPYDRKPLPEKSSDFSLDGDDEDGSLKERVH
ncbi:hypothetical protein V6N11_066804 [Hibiscus sabdariffa]|uniref:Mitochondrial ATP synthase subunit G protein n=1 Tax=Hibiscus sabdariffa TaxID=183260 RepID=A0ABR2SPU5_9ROSI